MLSPSSLLDRTLDALAKLCLRHSKPIAIVAALLALGGIVAATRLKFDPDLLNLIPQKNKHVREFRKVLRDLGTIDNHIVVLHMPSGHDVTEYDELIEAVAAGYRQSPRIEEVSHRLPNPLDFVQLILPRAMLFLPPEELDAVAQKLTDDGIRASVARNRTLLQTPQSFAIKQLIQYDPFNLAPLFLKKFQAASGGFTIDTSSGYYLSSDQSTLLIITKPRRPAQDVPFAKELLAEAAIVETRALTAFQKSAPPGTPLPRIEHTGGYEIAVGDATIIRKDIIINVVCSTVGVLAIFLWGFRRPASIAYAGMPMALALALTFGMAGLVYGTLSSLSAGFAALLAGLGIDFIMVSYGRYVDERNRGAHMAHGLIVAIRKSMPGVILAALTTAATFFAFLSTEFQGMAQLGLLTGTGILFFLVSTAFLLPALLVISERRTRPSRLFHHSFGTTSLVETALAWPRATIAFWVIFTIGTTLLATRVRFSDNIQDLRAKGNPGVVNQEEVTSKFGQSFEFMMYVVEGQKLDDVLERTRSAIRELDAFVQNGTIAHYQSIATFIPPRDQQLATMAELERRRGDEFNFDRISKTFREALIANGFRPEAYEHYLALFAQALSPEDPISLDKLDDEELLRLTSRFVKQSNDGWMSVIYLYPKGGKWPREVPPELLKMADRHPEDVLTGVNLVSSTLRRIVKADAFRATIIAAIAVTLIFYAAYRSVTDAALSFVPFVAGMSGMLGLMALFDLEFNFMNIFIGVMLVGVATDYAIYMLHRYREDKPGFRESAPETAKAIAMAALTTIVGYGTLALSHYPGLRSIGYASTFGIGLSALAAITLLPAMLVLAKHEGGRTEDESNGDHPPNAS